MVHSTRMNILFFTVVLISLSVSHARSVTIRQESEEYRGKTTTTIIVNLEEEGRVSGDKDIRRCKKAISDVIKGTLKKRSEHTIYIEFTNLLKIAEGEVYSYFFEKSLPYHITPDPAYYHVDPAPEIYVTCDLLEKHIDSNDRGIQTLKTHLQKRRSEIANNYQKSISRYAGAAAAAADDDDEDRRGEWSMDEVSADTPISSDAEDNYVVRGDSSSDQDFNDSDDSHGMTAGERGYMRGYYERR